jgi:hypothetical protein
VIFSFQYERYFPERVPHCQIEPQNIFFSPLGKPYFRFLSMWFFKMAPRLRAPPGHGGAVRLIEPLRKGPFRRDGHVLFFVSQLIRPGPPRGALRGGGIHRIWGHGGLNPHHRNTFTEKETGTFAHTIQLYYFPGFSFTRSWYQISTGV